MSLEAASAGNESAPPVIPGWPPQPPPPPRVWTSFLAYGLVIAVQVAMIAALVGLLVVFSKGAFGETDMENYLASVPGMLFVMMMSMAIVGGTAFFAAEFSPVRKKQRLRLYPITGPKWIFPASCFGSLGLALAFVGLDNLGLIPHSSTLKMLDEFVRQLTPATLVVTIFVMGVLPGVCEESLFRGYIQTRLVQRWGAVAGVVCTAVMFGVMHFDLVQGTFAGLLGLFIGYAVERTGSIAPAMVGHAFSNSVMTVLSYIKLEIPGVSANVILLCAGLATCALCTLAISKYPSRASV